MKHAYLILMVALCYNCSKSSTPRPTEVHLNNSVSHDNGTIGYLGQIHKALASRPFWDGVITITNRKPFGANYGFYDAGADFKNSNNASLAHGDLLINDNVLQYSEKRKVYAPMLSAAARSQSMRRCFGDSVDIQLFDRDSASIILKDKLYAPKALFVETTGFHNLSYAPNLSRTATISWNPDPNNQNGVFIEFSFSSQIGANDAFSTYKTIITPVHTEDDGEYQCTNTEFAGMPSGAVIEVSVARINVDSMVDVRGGQYLVYAYSRCSNYFYVE
jgi:hypothetical protein